MRAPALPSPRRIAAGAGLALLAAGLTPIAASANPAGTGLVISEVYGGGGNTGATYNDDFVELYNPTGAADQRRRLVASSTARDGTGAAHRRDAADRLGAGRRPLPGPGRPRGTAGATNLPTPDATGTDVAAWRGGAGQVILAQQRHRPPVDPADGQRASAARRRSSTLGRRAAPRRRCRRPRPRRPAQRATSPAPRPPSRAPRSRHRHRQQRPADFAVTGHAPATAALAVHWTATASGRRPAPGVVTGTPPSPRSRAPARRRPRDGRRRSPPQGVVTAIATRTGRLQRRSTSRPGGTGGGQRTPTPGALATRSSSTAAERLHDARPGRRRLRRGHRRGRRSSPASPRSPPATGRSPSTRRSTPARRRPCPRHDCALPALPDGTELGRPARRTRASCSPPTGRLHRHQQSFTAPTGLRARSASRHERHAR